MGRLKHAIQLAGKDWMLFWADRRSALLCLLVPILLASIFGYVFDRPDDPMQNRTITIGLVVEEADSAALNLKDKLRQHSHLDVVPADREALELALQRNKYRVGIIIPKGYDPLQQPKLEVLHHPLAQLETRFVEGLLTEVCLKERAARQLPQLLNNSNQWDWSLPIQRSQFPATGTHVFHSYSHSFCGMTLQYLLFWGMECGLLFLRERQRGIWRRLRSSPVSIESILLGRILGSSSLALLQVLVTFAFGAVFFGVKVTGSWLGFGILVIAICCLSAVTGLVVATLSATESRARSLSILAILLVSLLGGLWVPSFVLPDWVQQFARWLPTTWAMHALDGVTWQGLGFTEVRLSLIVLFSFVVGLGALALLRLYTLERIHLSGRGWLAGLSKKPLQRPRRITTTTT